MAPDTDYSESVLFDSFLETHDYGICIKDIQGYYVRVNKRGTQILGYEDPGQMIGKTDYELYPFRKAKENSTDDGSILNNSRSLIIKTESIINNSGDVEHYRLEKTPLRDRNGNIIGIIYLIKNIESTGIKSENPVKEVKNDCAFCYLNSPEPAYKWKRINDDFILIGYNVAANEITDRDMDLFLNRKASILFRGRNDIVDDLNLCLNKNKPFTRKMEYEYASGFTKNLEVTFIPQNSDCIVVFTKDISEEQNAKECLDYEAIIMQALMEQIPDKIYLKDRDGKLLRINQSVAGWHGYDDPSKLIGKSDFDLCEFTRATKFKADEDGIFQTGKPIINQIEQFETKSGDKYWHSTTKVPIINRNGNILAILCISRNITDLMNMELRLEQINRLFRLLENNISDIICLIDFEATITYITPSIVNMLGYSPAEIYKKGMRLLFGRNNLQKIDELLRYGAQKAANEQMWDSTLRILNRTKSGDSLWLEVRFSLLRNESGKSIGTIVIMRNITEQIAIEDELIKSQELYQGIVNDQSELICRFKSTNGEITFANKAYQNYFCAEDDSIIGKSLFDFIPNSEKEFVRQRFGAITLDLPTEKHINNVCLKNGEVRYIEWTNRGISNSAGEIIEYQSVGRDITDVKIAEDKINNLSVFRDNLINDLNIFIHVFDHELITIEWNRGAESITGFARDEIINTKNWMNLYPDNEYLCNLRERVRRAMIEGDSIENFETQITCKNRRVKYLVGDVKFLHGIGGSNMCGIAVGRDITKLRESVAALSKSEKFIQKITELIPFCIFLYDRNKKCVVYHNNKLKGLIGYEIGQIIEGEIKIENLILQQDYECIIKPFIENVHKLDVNVCGEQLSFRVIDCGGNVKWLLAEAVSYDRNDKGDMFLVILGDISELKYAQEELQVAHNELEFKVIERTTALEKLTAHLKKEVSTRKRQEGKTRKALKDRELLLSEIHHRVKNNLQLISSLLSLQMDEISPNNMKDMIEDYQSRITSIALVHEQLYLSKNIAYIEWKKYIERLIENVLHSYGKDKILPESEIRVENIMLGIDKGIPLGLIINELISNSIKHARNKENKLKVRVTLKKQEEEMELIYADNGDGFSGNFDFEGSSSFGLHLINMLARQMNGRIAGETGNIFRMTFSPK